MAEKFNPRDVTWLAFNERVMQEAMDKTIGGQAKAQGETFTGALKNVDAALGRLGETILSTPFS